MNAFSKFTQCDFTYKETTDKKTEAIFKGKVKSTQTKPKVKDNCTTTNEVNISLGAGFCNSTSSGNSDFGNLPFGEATATNELLSSFPDNSGDDFDNSIGVRPNSSFVNINSKTTVLFSSVQLKEQSTPRDSYVQSVLNVNNSSDNSSKDGSYCETLILGKRTASEELPNCSSKAFLSGYDVPDSEALRQVKQILENRLDLDYYYQNDNIGSFSCLTVSRRDMFQDLGGLYEVPVKIQFSSNGILSVLLSFKPAIRETYYDNETLKIDLNVLDRALIYLNGNNVFCSGIKTEFKNGKATSLDVIHLPCERQQSKHCPVIFRPPQTSLDEGKRSFICPKCSALEKYLKRREKVMEVTPRTKIRRSHISSKFPIENLTPKSRHTRIKNLRNHRYRQKNRLSKIEKELKENSITLNPEQSHEMSQILKEMNDNHKDKVKKIILEVKKRNPLLAHAFQASWDTDSKNSKLSEFINDQVKNPGTSTGNRFGPLTYRLALSLYSRSPASYRTLQGLKIFNLPSVDTVKKKLQKIKCVPGVDFEHLKKESDRFKATFKSVEIPPPQDGFLVMDEVKVIGNMVWNSNSNEFIGLAMNPEEVPSLHNF